MRTKILQPTKDNYKICADAIKNGEVVAFPTETVYGLGGNALNDDSVQKIFTAKGRPSDNPLIVHLSDLKSIEKYAYITTKCASQIIQNFMPGPITIVAKKRPEISDLVTCGLDTVGIRIPINELARDFISACGVPIAAPSANTSGRPSPTKAIHVYEDLKDKIPYIIDGGSSNIGIESTVVDVTSEVPVILRAGKITLQDIISVCGAGKINGGIGTDEKVRSPGVKYRHYAPKCEVVLVSHNNISKIESLYKDYFSQGKKPIVLCFDKTKFALKDLGLNLFSLGASNEQVAANLYDGLRKCEDHSDIIILEASADMGFGQSLIDRMRKSAGKNEV